MTHPHDIPHPDVTAREYPQSGHSSSSRPSFRPRATMRRTLVEPAAVVVELPVALGRERLAQLGADLLADLLAGRVEDGQLLLGEVVVDHLGQLLDRVVEGLGVGALELEHRQQRLVALGVLLLAVLGLVLGDRVLAAQLRVDVLLLGLGVRDVQRGERLAYGVAVGRCCRAGRAAAPRSGGGRRGSGRRRHRRRAGRGRWECSCRQPARGVLTLSDALHDAGSRLQQHLDGAPLVHRAVALGDLVERQRRGRRPGPGSIAPVERPARAARAGSARTGAMPPARPTLRWNIRRTGSSTPCGTPTKPTVDAGPGDAERRSSSTRRCRRTRARRPRRCRR